jgi:hypothetical protein
MVNNIVNIKIENMIYEIRGKQVMLDSDLAILYKCKNGTKSINLAVKRHLNKFPERFMFQLSKEEYYSILRFQSETLELNTIKNTKYLPYVFTEQGVAMLAATLKTKVADEISIKIMDAFVVMKKYISSNLIQQKYINNLVLEDHYRLQKIEASLNKLGEKKLTNEIYFKGQIYDAYSKIKDIFETAESELIIIDNYVDKTILDMIKNFNIKVLLMTKKKNKLLSKLDIEKYNSQYTNLTIKYTDDFHDRYFIIDKNIVYHCGTSINYAGSKTFSINLLEDNLLKNNLINYIYNNIK